MSDETDDSESNWSAVDRKHKLANMAATITAGIEMNPECDEWDMEDIAERAVFLAEEILKKVGL